MSEQVAAFRRGLDIGKANDASSGKSGLFDLALANELYGTLLGPVETLVKDKRSSAGGAVGIADGAAVSSPGDVEAGCRDPRHIRRLSRCGLAAQAPGGVGIAVGRKPLKTLRVFARKEQGTKPMTGFGDPLFDPSQVGGGDKRGATKPGSVKSAARGVTNAAYTDFWKGAGVDRARLAQALPQLPDTADELNAVAKDLGVSSADIHLGEDASETTVKRAPLADYSIVYFATHGLVAGDVKGVAEPSLVLSIPKQPSEFDDGLLTASEVAQLKLNADWVVLSACHTIAGDKPGAEALSGAGAVVLLCRRPRAAGVALGGGFGSRHAACDIDLRSPESRSETRPRRGAAPGHAGLSQ